MLNRMKCSPRQKPKTKPLQVLPPTPEIPATLALPTHHLLVWIHCEQRNIHALPIHEDADWVPVLTEFVEWKLRRHTPKAYVLKFLPSGQSTPVTLNKHIARLQNGVVLCCQKDELTLDVRVEKRSNVYSAGWTFSTQSESWKHMVQKTNGVCPFSSGYYLPRQGHD